MTGFTRTIAGVAERVIRYAILGVFVAGVRRRNPSAVVNAVLAFGASYLPDVLESRHVITFRPWERVYIATAMLTHSVGMLGPYDDVWWWDHLTHTHSATLLGSLVHKLARRRGRDPQRRVVGAVLGVGILWEVLEYAIHVTAKRFGLEPLLVTYGKSDTLLDLGFDLLGALLVLAFGDRFFGEKRR